MDAATGTKQIHRETRFLERYDRLLKWAVQLTRPDRELAKDIVQDAFIQFTQSERDLADINSIDNYLYGVVRNAHLSYLRRTLRRQHEQLSDFELDFTEVPFATTDPHRQLLIKDELRAICRHACLRKDTSVKGSVLILRFFHGYFPNEVAKLLRCSRNTMDVQLNAARIEAIGALTRPPQRGYVDGTTPAATSVRKSCSPDDLMIELREFIFASKRGDCFLPGQLAELYRPRKALTRAALSHLVSCHECLDQANALLGLPLLSERNAIDAMMREQGSDVDRLGSLLTAFARTLCALIGWSPVWLSCMSLANDYLDSL